MGYGEYDKICNANAVLIRNLGKLDLAHEQCAPQERNMVVTSLPRSDRSSFSGVDRIGRSLDKGC